MAPKVLDKTTIYNPITNKYVNKNTDIGKKLLNYKEEEKILYSVRDCLEKFINEIVSKHNDKSITEIFSELPEEDRFVLDQYIPIAWRNGEKYDLDKKPRNVMASKLYTEYRKPILLQEIDDEDIPEISTMIKNEWKKLSNKERKNRSVNIKFTSLAKIENKKIKERIADYNERHKNDKPKELSESDRKKLEERPDIYELNDITGRIVKIKKDKKVSKKQSKQQTYESEHNSTDQETEQETDQGSETNDEEYVEAEELCEEDLCSSDSEYE